MEKLVVYFSYTDHTRMIAERVSERLNCDIVEIKTITPYSTNYQEVVDDEQNSEASNYLPKIEDINIDLTKYDEIILGTPVWWYRPAPAIRSFLIKYNLTDKTICPFATNAGWLGRTFTEIKKMCPNSNVENEMNIKFSTDYSENRLITSEEEINSWISKLQIYIIIYWLDSI